MNTEAIVIPILWAAFIFVLVLYGFRGDKIAKLLRQLSSLTVKAKMYEDKLHTLQNMVKHHAVFRCHRCGRFMSQAETYMIDDEPCCEEHWKLYLKLKQGEQGKKFLP